MENWWTKSASKSKHHPQIARVVNAARLGIDLDDKADRERSRLIQAIAAATQADATGTDSEADPARQIAIVSDETSGQILSLSHLLSPQITLILTPAGIAPEISPDYDRVFIYRSSEALQAAIGTRDRAEIVPVMKWLSEAVRPSA